MRWKLGPEGPGVGEKEAGSALAEFGLGEPGLNELCEALGGGVDGFWALAEGEADLGGAVPGVVVEAGAGDAGDSDFFYEMMGEGAVVEEAEGADVGHDVVSAAG